MAFEHFPLNPVKQNRGFTLLELMLVLFIMVLGMGVIGVKLSSGQGPAELKAAAREIASALRHARGRALTNRQDQAVIFDLAENAYQITGVYPPRNIPSSIDVTLDIAKADIDQNGGRVRFFPDGSSTGGRVTLSQGQREERIDINWLTGQVGVAAEEPETSSRKKHK